MKYVDGMFILVYLYLEYNGGLYYIKYSIRKKYILNFIYYIIMVVLRWLSVMSL